MTQDVDAYTELDWAVQKEFERLLKEQGVFLDPQSAEVWMPCETNYVQSTKDECVWLRSRCRRRACVQSTQGPSKK